MPRPLPVHGEAEAASETPETLLALREAGSLTGNRKGPGRPQRRRNDSLATVARGGGEQVREVYGEQGLRETDGPDRALVQCQKSNHGRPGWVVARAADSRKQPSGRDVFAGGLRAGQYGPEEWAGEVKRRSQAREASGLGIRNGLRRAERMLMH